MSEDEENEDLIALQHVYSRRRNRDTYYWRQPKLNAMRNLYQDFQEWIAQEAKDLIILIDILKKTNQQPIINQIEPYEKRIKEIQKEFMRKTIAPMKSMAKGTLGTRTDEEHCRKFRILLDNAFSLILEMRKMRETLDIVFEAWSSVGSEGERPTYIR